MTPFFRCVCKKLNETEAIVATALLAILSILVIAQVFYRYVLNSSIAWSEEITLYIMVWATYIGSADVMKKDKHFAITFLDHRMHGLRRRVVRSIVFLSNIAFLSYGVWAGASAAFFLKGAQQTTALLQIPLYLIYLAIPLGFSAMLIRALVLLFKVWTTDIDHEERTEFIT